MGLWCDFPYVGDVNVKNYVKSNSNKTQRSKIKQTVCIIYINHKNYDILGSSNNVYAVCFTIFL